MQGINFLTPSPVPVKSQETRASGGEKKFAC